MLRFMGWQRFGHDWETKLNWTEVLIAINSLRTTSSCYEFLVLYHFGQKKYLGWLTLIHITYETVRRVNPELSSQEKIFSSSLILYLDENESVSCSLSHVWLCNPMDCSPPGSSVHGIFQARILEWVAIYYSRRSSNSRRVWTHISCTSCFGRQVRYY